VILLATFVAYSFRRGGLNDVSTLVKLFREEKMREWFLFPEHENELLQYSTGSNWCLIFCSSDSLHRLSKSGAHIVGLDGVWKWLR